MLALNSVACMLLAHLRFRFGWCMSRAARWTLSLTIIRMAFVSVVFSNNLIGMPRCLRGSNECCRDRFANNAAVSACCSCSGYGLIMAQAWSCLGGSEGRHSQEIEDLTTAL